MTGSENNMNGIAALGFGFMLGAVVGVAFGMLYAPRPGIETREMITEKTEEAREKIGEAVEKVKKKASGLRRAPEAD